MLESDGSIHAMSAPVAQDFARLPVNGAHDNLDGNDDDEGLESVNAPPQGGKAAGTPPPALRPTGTHVDATTDFTADALKAGFLSGMGIIARMQVLPNSTAWDGKEVVESLSQTSSSCPDTLTRPGPCNGHSHFPIGAQMRGRGVRPVQPALSSHFYDVHTSQSESVSFLHDATRNPKNLSSCQSVCRQDYAFDGVVIGSHSITRQFRKGTYGGHDVTIVDVTKADIATTPPGSTTPAGGQGSGSGSGSPSATPGAKKP
ncbi:hypothetical protein [Rhodanobacter sp. MP7CTX1]|uniref:hypothetical protein n=1 Tax=Rhodanobacter sp. MP7CTX1 TaxID=2723084 RepID=UPI0016127E71|nr:hypothetical protein [Rhodanobacter sp. MP7CTX1]MBB6187827.1 hypothetical protein [Rhodanobacter sp. MP7CTX1]